MDYTARQRLILHLLDSLSQWYVAADRPCDCFTDAVNSLCDQFHRCGV